MVIRSERISEFARQKNMEKKFHSTPNSSACGGFNQRQTLPMLTIVVTFIVAIGFRADN